MSLLLNRILLLVSFLFTIVSVYAQERVFVSCGDEELDGIRLKVAKQPTTRENFEIRALKMKLWVVILQQQGARLKAYLRIDKAFRKDISTPAIYKGKIYIMSSDGYVHAIK